MIVYKFGGASVADAKNIKNVAEIIKNSEEDQIAVVISAMGKTTNALEDLLKISRTDQDFTERLKLLIDNHTLIINELFGFTNEIPALNDLFDQLSENLSKYKGESYDFAYDQIVSFGEFISATIVFTYLEYLELSTSFVDARQMIYTDATYREGVVDWDRTLLAVKSKLEQQVGKHIYITQGFIGSTKNGSTTTLGREGSDFTAAIVSFCIDAEYMAIWKDVPGILTADPRLFDNVALIDRLSYREAIEMTYYGAKVIHPKTIKPIQNKNIPLWVKSFVNPKGIGTLISGEIELTYPPMIVIEPDQALIHISTKDFSFVGEEHLSKLFQIFNKHRVRVNMMRNTAISFSVCTNNIEDRISNLKKDIQDDFNMVVDHGLELITIRHYTEDLVEKLKKGKIQLFEERLQKTIQIVVKDVPNMIRKA